jgi:hypothetical protein
MIVKLVKSYALTINKKHQEDRLLKQLPYVERQQQKRLRQLIKDDPFFRTV